MKNYVVRVFTKNWTMGFNCNSLRIAMFIVNLKIWEFAKVIKIETWDCIAFRRRES